MKQKDDKNKDFEFLREELAKVKNLFVTGYEKIRVDQDFELRKAVRGAGGQYKVIKNNLAEIASEGTDSAGALKDLKGMTSIAFTYDDPVALAKVLTAYAKANPAFTFKAGMVEGRVIDVKAIAELASLPSKEVVFSKLLYMINAPATRLATMINAAGRSLAVVIDQGVQENKFNG